MVIASLLLLAGCSDAGDPAATPRSGTRSDTSPSTDARAGDDPGATGSAGSGAASPLDAPAPPPPAPPGSGCYRIPFGDLTRPTNDRRPVDCTTRHDAQTFHVGTLDLVVAGHALAVDADRVVAEIERSCDRRLVEYLGGTGEDRRLTRLRAVWFAPTLEQADRGARWYRCDVVALAGNDELLRLPPPQQLRGVLDRPSGSTYGLCGTAAPGDPDFTRVICARRHAWRAVATIALPDGDAYPGAGAVRAAGDDRCRDLVRDLVDDPLTFRFGWEWPTREQWRAGQRHGYCWAPD
ncbi:MAG TPA: septum formation family protein [Nocardioides sp.]|nr:septum formation family protein [Nocardioides sp.]